MSNITYHVDIVVICALEIEYDALYEASKKNGDFEHKELSLPGLTLEYPRSFISNTSNGLSVLFAELPVNPGCGNILSATMAKELIGLFNPWLVISFGIAGSLDKKEFKIGDVAFARKVAYIDLRKEVEKDNSSEKELLNPTKDILSWNTNFSVLRSFFEWMQGDYEKDYEVKLAYVVSSEAVVKSEESEKRKIVKSACQDAKVIEMEAYGIAEACNHTYIHSESQPVCWAAVKGISDLADKDKGQKKNKGNGKDRIEEEKKDSKGDHQKASEHAAHFLMDFLSQKNIAENRLREENSYRPRPFKIQYFHDGETSKKGTDNFLKDVSPLLDQNNEDKMNRIKYNLWQVHARNPRPPVFYHWRIAENGLHFNEMRFMQILLKLSKKGYSVNCLITDKHTDFSHQKLTSQSQVNAARVNVKKLIESIFDGNKVNIFFLKELKVSQINNYAYKCKYNLPEFEEFYNKYIEKSASKVKLKEYNYQLKNWFKFISWYLRNEEAGIVLYGESSHYQYLKLFSNIIPALIPTRFYEVYSDNKNLKPCRFEIPAIICPPFHEQALQWLFEEGDTKNLQIIWSLITRIQELDVDKRGEESKPPGLDKEFDMEKMKRMFKEHTNKKKSNFDVEDSQLLGFLNKKGDYKDSEITKKLLETIKDKSSDLVFEEKQDLKIAILLELDWINYKYFKNLEVEPINE